MNVGIYCFDAFEEGQVGDGHEDGCVWGIVFYSEMEEGFVGDWHLVWVKRTLNAELIDSELGDSAKVTRVKVRCEFDLATSDFETVGCFGGPHFVRLI